MTRPADSLDFLDDLRITCVGDVILDRFRRGEIERISREAPVPILRTAAVTSMPGGAGNVAANLASLGIDCDFLSVVGEDSEADTLQRLLDEWKYIDPTLIREKGRSTPQSTRYTSQKQQVFRTDSYSGQDLLDSSRRRLLDESDASFRRSQALILSDYGRGVLDGPTLQGLIDRARRHRLPVIIDPRKADYRLYRGASLITPNVAELERAWGESCPDAEALGRAGRAMARITGANILITQGERGMTLVPRTGDIRHYPTQARDVIDVSGAGDTVVAIVAAGLARKWAFDRIVPLANRAAGLVVTKSGTATLSRSELALDHHFSCPVMDGGTQIEAIGRIVGQWREESRRVGLTNGCFDVFHAGHAHIIDHARSRCDRLVVAVNSDASIRALKGRSRPIVGQEDRCRVIAAMRSVDLVVIFAEKTPEKLIGALRPDVLIKGADYRPEEMVGADIVEGRGGTIHRVPLLKGRSTTSIIDAIRKDQGS